MEDKRKQIREKVDFLNRAARAYYQENREMISNLEYDRLYDELQQMEKETGIVLGNSPTLNVGYQILSDLPREAHQRPMLSLDKTKDPEELKDWLGEQQGLLSWKIDGLTIVLTYRQGKLYKAVTRGNGEIGEVVTNNAAVFANLPVVIPFQGELTLRGEACITYSDFKKINEIIEDIDAKYKNPRNLCSGSVRQLNNEITAQRKVHFYGFSLVEAQGEHFETRQQQMLWLQQQGFEVVEFKMTDRSSLDHTISWFENHIQTNDVPSDGLVLLMDNIAYGTSLGATSKFPKDSIAFKWKDETKETVLKEIEWSASRTGLINPVAIFEPVELEGTTVSRASVHNISILKELALGIGDRITVYKANMIIPQVAENFTRSGELEIPDNCPVCSGEAAIKKDNDVEVLYCTNPKCIAKQIKSFTHFVSRNAMNIDGLSEATLQKFIGAGFVEELADLFKLSRHKEELIQMEGFGEKSYGNLIEAVDNARETTPARLLYSLGIGGIGVANAKLISLACENRWDKIQRLTEEELVAIDGIGEVMAQQYTAFFNNEKNGNRIADLLKELKLDESFVPIEQAALAGKTFVITGSLDHYGNRDALKEVIQQAGGKVTGSVSKKTSYLINNDVDSPSSKNKKARELEIPILTEDKFLKLLETGEKEHA